MTETATRSKNGVAESVVPRADVSQSDLAAILYSSGTTGKVKGVMLTHRNLIAVAAGHDAARPQRESPSICLHTMPYFHVYGFTFSMRSVVLSETGVLIERFEVRKMLRAVEEFGVTHLAVVPPVVVAMAKEAVTDGYDLRSLEGIACGAAPIGIDAVAALKSKFPRIVFVQVCQFVFDSERVFRYSTVNGTVRKSYLKLNIYIFF